MAANKRFEGEAGDELLKELRTSKMIEFYNRGVFIMRLPAALVFALSSKLSVCWTNPDAERSPKDGFLGCRRPSDSGALLFSDCLVKWFYTGRLITEPDQYQYCWYTGETIGAPSLRNYALEKLCEALSTRNPDEIVTLVERPLNEMTSMLRLCQNADNELEDLFYEKDERGTYWPVDSNKLHKLALSILIYLGPKHSKAVKFFEEGNNFASHLAILMVEEASSGNKLPPWDPASRHRYIVYDPQMSSSCSKKRPRASE